MNIVGTIEDMENNNEIHKTEKSFWLNKLKGNRCKLASVESLTHLDDENTLLNSSPDDDLNISFDNDLSDDLNDYLDNCLRFNCYRDQSSILFDSRIRHPICFGETKNIADIPYADECEDGLTEIPSSNYTDDLSLSEPQRIQTSTEQLGDEASKLLTCKKSEQTVICLDDSISSDAGWSDDTSLTIETPAYFKHVLPVPEDDEEDNITVFMDLPHTWPRANGMDGEEVGTVISGVTSLQDPTETSTPTSVPRRSPNNQVASSVEKPKLNVSVDVSKQPIGSQERPYTLNSPEEQEIIAQVNRSFSRSSSVTFSPITDRIEKEMAMYESQDILTKVHKPEKIVKPMESYVVFTVCTKTTREEYGEPEYSVKRRYNDFLWLHSQLAHQHPLLILPPLPEKQSMTLDRFDRKFISYREAALARFLARLCQHPLYSHSNSLQAFLTLEPKAFSRYKKTSNSSSSHSITSYLQTPYSSYKHLVTPSYHHQALYKYADRFGEKMAAIESVTQRLCHRQSDYVRCTLTYISTYNQWSSNETTLSSSLSSMAEFYDHLLVSCQNLIDQSTLKVSLPLKEYVLFSAVIKSTLDRRDYEQYQSEKSLEKARDQGGSSAGLSASASNGGGASVAASVHTGKTAMTDTKGDHSQVSGEDNAVDQLEIANAEFDADFQRWTINKNQDLRTCIEGIATRNINFYDSQISCLESLLKNLKDRKPES